MTDSVSLAARHKLPAVYFERHCVATGGLISYGPDQIDMYRRGGLCRPHPKGRKARRSPGKEPTKYDLVINLKTAKALGLAIPVNLQQLADQVIE